MLPKKERLQRLDFKDLRPRIFFRGTYVDISANTSKETKFTCIIQKKRIKKAVDRNSVRRKIYSIIQTIRPKKPYFIIMYPKQNVRTSNYSQIMTEIKSAFDTL